MAISFNEVPQTRVPFVYVEFDNSRAQQGPSIQPHRVLAVGQRLSAGSKPELQLDQVFSADQAKEYYGNGSIMAQMLEKVFANNLVNEVFAISVDDDGAANAAAGELLIGGSPSEAGTLSFMIGGRRVRVGVSSGDTPAAIASDLVAAINDDSDMAVSAAVNGGTPEQVDLTAKNAGELGNDIDLRLNPFDGEVLPAGLTGAITDMSGGTANPDLSSVIPIMGEEQYLEICWPYTDTANLTVIEDELEDRFGPIRQNDGVAFAARRGTAGQLTTFGSGRNSPHVSVMGIQGPNSPWEWVGAICGTLAKSGQIDPARPFQTLEMDGLIAPDLSSFFTFNERDSLLNNGIATFKAQRDGSVTIERMITTYQTNAQGAPDTSYLDVNTLFTLSYLRFDFRNTFLRKFPRHKLANDGTRFAQGQAVLTPKAARAEAVAKFREWEFAGLVEGAEQFKRDLIVERSVTDVNRLDFLLPPDLINQLRVVGAQVQFLL